MPILFQICVEGNRGSTGTIAETIGKLVIEKGWESYIAHGRFPRPSKSKLIKIGSRWSIFLHGLQTRLFDRHCLGSKHATQKLVKQITEIKPDIIHLHHIHGYYINMIVLFKFLSKANIPVVWTFHDCWSFTGHCAYFDFVGCDKWKTECRQCPQKKEYPASLFIDRSRKNFHLKQELFTSVPEMAIVPVSYWLENLMTESFLSKINCKTIHNGIDTSVFKPQNNTTSIKARYGLENKFVALGVANPWVARKGLKDFIELSKIISDEEAILLVGLSQKQLKNLPSNIIGLARTENRQQLVELYSAVDLFVNPTWEDNFPTTNLESLACGTPVVTYHTGGSIESIFEDTGFIVNKGDVAGLYEVIKTVQQKGKSFYSENCRKHALSFYNNQHQFEKYTSLYTQLLKN